MALIKPVNLKDGFYIEITPRLGGDPIKLRRDSMAEIDELRSLYEKTKNVKFLGYVEDGKMTIPE